MKSPPRLEGWKVETPAGNPPYDCLLRRADVAIRVQVKTQRRDAGQPKRYRKGSSKFVVETQRTRSGSDAEGGSTRPYRFGEFDILAVCMEASCGQWARFLYTLERWLLPRPSDPSRIATLQPVSPEPDEDWTDSLETAIDWWLEGTTKRISD